jgi:hypothetical protein
MPGDRSPIALSIRPVHLKSLSGAGLHRFNKNFRVIGIEASILLFPFGKTLRKKTKAAGGD